MPFDGPAAGIGDLSRMDLSNDEVVKDAEHELRHCQSDHDLARSARRWGERAIVQIRDGDRHDEEWVPKSEHESLNDTLTALLAEAIRAADDIWETLKGSTGPKTEAINLSIAALREAIDIAEIEE